MLVVGCVAREPSKAAMVAECHSVVAGSEDYLGFIVAAVHVDRRAVAVQ
jgi:hypothetical protein